MDMLSTLPKYSYQYTSINNGGVGLGLDTKKDFDEDREKRIQLYALRWEKGYECISGKPMLGSALKEWYEWRKFYKRNTENNKKFISEEK
jgi:hypothetical protein